MRDEKAGTVLTSESNSEQHRLDAAAQSQTAGAPLREGISTERQMSTTPNEFRRAASQVACHVFMLTTIVTILVFALLMYRMTSRLVVTDAELWPIEHIHSQSPNLDHAEAFVEEQLASFSGFFVPERQADSHDRQLQSNDPLDANSPIQRTSIFIQGIPNLGAAQRRVQKQKASSFQRRTLVVQRTLLIGTVILILSLLIYLTTQFKERKLTQQALRDSEASCRHLSIRLLRLQDDERRRLARELHDSLGQYLSLLRLNVSWIEQSTPAKPELISECRQIIDKCLSETRTISQLLHPPLLEELGLLSALQWYAKGFSVRSGIDVRLSLPSVLPRLRTEIELVIFRIVQEALTNAHRHSGSQWVDVGLEVNNSTAVLSIQDYGSGVPSQFFSDFQSGKTGVGLSSMRERVRDIGGVLELKSEGGFSITVTIPNALRPAPHEQQKTVP